MSLADQYRNILGKTDTKTKDDDIKTKDNHIEEEDEDDDIDDDTHFISTCHSVRFDAPVSHLCNCVYHIVPSQNNQNMKTKAINCFAVAGRDGFIRIFESDAPFSSLFAFPIRYERVLSLEFLPKTSSFITLEHTADGSGNHVVIYEDWHKFPNLLKNVQVVEKGQDIIFNFVSSRGLPSNGYIAITAPGNMRLKSFEVEGINGQQSFKFDVKIRTIQIAADGTIISSNTIVNASASTNNSENIQYISHLDINDNNDSLQSSHKRSSSKYGKRSEQTTTTLLVFELKTHKNVRLGPGAYRLSFPVAWKSRSRQRFRRKLFAVELCDEKGRVIEAAQKLWIVDIETATAAAHGYTTHPRHGGKLNVCAENIRSLRKPLYIDQMKIFELGDRGRNDNTLMNEDEEYESANAYSSQSWFPSDFSASSGSNLNESVCCMNVCKESGRIVTCAKSLISIYDCDLLLRTFQIPHLRYIKIEQNDISNIVVDDTQIEIISKYRLGATNNRIRKKSKKQQIKQMITIRTPPLKLLSLHASFVVILLNLNQNYLAFASDHEMRMVYLDIIAHHQTNNQKKNEQKNNENEQENEEIIIDIHKNQKEKKQKIPKNKEEHEQNEEIDDDNVSKLDLSETDSESEQKMDSTDLNLEFMKELKSKTNASTMRNVCVVFDENGRPSMKHHAASFMLIPSIYEFNRFSESNSYVHMIGDFADHAHRIDLNTQIIEDLNFMQSPSTHSNMTSLANKLVGNVSILNDNLRSFDVSKLDFNVIEKEILDRSQSMFDIQQISMMIHRRFSTSKRIRSIQIIGNDGNKLLVATDDEIFVYDLVKQKMKYSLKCTSLIIETCLHDIFLFVLTEKDISVYSCMNDLLLLLWSHPLLRMRGLKILHQNKFCLEFGSQTDQDRFSVNADGKRIRTQPFDLRLRLQSPNDPDKRPLTIFEQNSPKNVLIFEWAATSEMVLSLITKSHESITEKAFDKSLHLLLIALELLKLRKSQILPLYESIKKTEPIIHQKLDRKHNENNEQKKEVETVKNNSSLTGLISSAWNWMNTNSMSSMIVGNVSSFSHNSSSSDQTPKKSVVQSEWQMLRQLNKECHGLLADVYAMQNKFDVAAQHYILSNRQFLQIRQTFLHQINKQTSNGMNGSIHCSHHHQKEAINGLTLFYRLFLEHERRINEESNAFTWHCMMQHFKCYQSYSFSTIFLHPFMLNIKFNLKCAMEWLDECIINETSIRNEDDTNPFSESNTNSFKVRSHFDAYKQVCPSTTISANAQIIQSTHYLAKVVLLCLKNDIGAAQNTLCMIESCQFFILLSAHKRLWLEWTHCITFRRLCCVTFPWEFARIVLDYTISCYAQHCHSKEIFSSLRPLTFNESLQYFEYESGGPSLMQCYLEGAVRFLVEQIDEFEAKQIETNRCLAELDHALYLKYLSEVEDAGFTLIELYVQYLQRVCYDDTTNILMQNMDNKEEEEEKANNNNQNSKGAVFERKRHLWNSQYPVILRPIPSWLSELLQRVQSELFEDENESQNEQMIVMTRICTLLSCIEFGASISKREKGAFLKKYRDKHVNFQKMNDGMKEKEKENNNNDNGVNIAWKRRFDLLMAACPDIPHKYVNAITIIGYVCCGCISEAIHIVLEREQSIVVPFALSYCKSLSDWRILLDQIMQMIATLEEEEEEKEKENEQKLEFLEDACKKIWTHLGRLSSLSTKQSEWLSVMDLISLVPDSGNMEFFAPIFNDLCRNQAGDSLNMELFDRIVRIEKDKDYGFNQQMHEVFYPQHTQ